MAPAQMPGDAAFSQTRLAADDLLIEREFGVEKLQAAAAKHCQRAVRWHGADGFRVIEIVAELGDVGVVFVAPGHQAGLETPFSPEPFTQFPDQQGVLGPALGKQIAHTVKHRRHISKATFGIDKGRRFSRWVERKIGEQPVRQWLEPSFAGDHALGPAPRLEGQVEVFKLLLGRRAFDCRAQLRRQLALFFNALEHRRPAQLELTQIAKTDLQFAQLDVVKPIGDFLAIAGDEGHGGPAIEQFHGSVDLRRPNLQLGGNLKQDFVQQSEVRVKRLIFPHEHGHSAATIPPRCQGGIER